MPLAGIRYLPPSARPALRYLWDHLSTAGAGPFPVTPAPTEHHCLHYHTHNEFHFLPLSFSRSSLTVTQVSTGVFPFTLLRYP